MSLQIENLDLSIYLFIYLFCSLLDDADSDSDICHQNIE